MLENTSKNTSFGPLISIVPFAMYSKQTHGCMCYYVEINLTSTIYKPIGTSKLYKKLENS